jgi:hypothetical protein
MIMPISRYRSIWFISANQKVVSHWAIDGPETIGVTLIRSSSL